VDIATISKRLGHAEPDITLRIYSHLFRKDDSKAAAINAALGQALNVSDADSGPIVSKGSDVAKLFATDYLANP
jgi:hypothetical protein